jgi:hypothetical protein
MITPLEQALGHTFARRDLLDQALTHASIPSSPSYERLEFLGDRVLGVVMAEWLLEAFPAESEGAIAKRFVRGGRGPEPFHPHTGAYGGSRPVVTGARRDFSRLL